MVMKKNILLGLALQLSLLFCNTNSTVAQEYNKRIAMEGVEMYGIVTFSPINQLDDMIPGLYKFGYDDNFKPDDNSVLFNRYISGGGVYHNGKIYCNIYSDEANMPEQKPVWTILDGETYKVLYEKELADNCQCTTTSLAYDVTNDKIYGIVVDYTNSHLVEVDPETGDMQRVGKDFESNLRFKTLVSDNNGMLYSVVLDTKDQGQYLYKIRKTDGMAVKVKAITGKNLIGPDDYLANGGTEQAMFINRATGKVYWIFESSSIELDSEYTPIVELNLTNAEGTIVSYLSRTYQVSGAWLKEPNEGAPGIVSDFEFVTPDDSSVSGYFQFQIPSESYLGTPLTDEKLNVKVTEGNKVLVDATAAPGSLFKSDAITLPNDNHTVKVTVSNEYGDGPTITRTFFAGYDLPKAPTNIKLTYDGLTTTLTWDAPTEGINGNAIDKDNITYKVVRYPYEITVAENLKECTFTETHPEDMTRYVYTVTAMYDGKEGGWGYSNNLIIGTPLNPPYGGMFTGPADMLNYYTLLDSNGDGYCWNYDSNTRSAVYIYNQQNDADDWMIAPPINYQKGVDYTLSFKAYSSLPKYPESMEVTFGKGRTPEEQTTQLLNITEVPGVDEEHPVTEYSVPVRVDEDGIYYFGFHVTSPKFHEFLYLFDIRLDVTTGINNVTGDEGVSVTTGKNTISISNPNGAKISVYSSDGMLVDSFTDAAYERTLHPGIYIVRTGKSAKKVIVQ